MSMPVVVIILVGVFLAFVILMVMSFRPKSMAEKMSKNMGNMGGLMGNMMKDAIQMQKQILEEHEDDLKELNKKGAEIESEGLEIKARAIKKGLVEDDPIGVFCKHCGQKIEGDSKFCKYCGKEQ